jgi:hypothetical protein
MFNRRMEERKKKIFISPRGDIGEDCHTSSNIGRI